MSFSIQFYEPITVTPLFFPAIIMLRPNYGLCMQVISATGGSGAQGNYDVSWTVGEIAITTLSRVLAT